MSKQNSLPRVGFISLGCPKATVDSEHILTRLRAEGYLISGSYQDADLVVVNTCGFIDSAVAESLDAIGEALAENGKVIVTGCLGAKGDVVKQAHPSVLAVTGPHATDEVMAEFVERKVYWETKLGASESKSPLLAKDARNGAPGLIWLTADR